MTDAELFERIRKLSDKKTVLAGGLNRYNVREMIEKTGAEAIDIMTGAERSPGEKDTAAIEGSIEAAIQSGKRG